jgi:hypothetical protein
MILTNNLAIIEFTIKLFQILKYIRNNHISELYRETVTDIIYEIGSTSNYNYFQVNSKENIVDFIKFTINGEDDMLNISYKLKTSYKTIWDACYINRLTTRRLFESECNLLDKASKINIIIDLIHFICINTRVSFEKYLENIADLLWKMMKVENTNESLQQGFIMYDLLLSYGHTDKSFKEIKHELAKIILPLYTQYLPH